ncbi:hypothetical protein Tcan_02041 [Toxocara canis]|nr:hypothetical protein Tcan_02041 [Toxocara canis]
MSARHRLLLGMYVDEMANDQPGQEHCQSEKSSPTSKTRTEFPPKDSALNREQFIRVYDFINAARIGNVRIARKSFAHMEEFLDELCLKLAADILSTVVHKGQI